jgi:hypothetical protein
MTQAFNLSQFANYVNSSGQVSASGLQAGLLIPSGTVSLFYQASAPTGWTQVTALNDFDLRVTSGAGGSTGGTTAYSSVFTNQTPTISLGGLSVGATTLSTGQMPSHNHGVIFGTQGEGQGYAYGSNDENRGSYGTQYAGGNGSHSHSISGSASSSAITLNVRYANIIFCSKN